MRRFAVMHGTCQVKAVFAMPRAMLTHACPPARPLALERLERECTDIIDSFARFPVGASSSQSTGTIQETLECRGTCKGTQNRRERRGKAGWRLSARWQRRRSEIGKLTALGDGPQGELVRRRSGVWHRPSAHVVGLGQVHGRFESVLATRACRETFRSLDRWVDFCRFGWHRRDWL